MWHAQVILKCFTAIKGKHAIYPMLFNVWPTVCETFQQTHSICITFVQRRPNVFDVGPTLYKCYTNVLCLLGCQTIKHDRDNVFAEVNELYLRLVRNDDKIACYLSLCPVHSPSKPPSTCESQYCGEPPWPRGSVLGLRPPVLEFRILCLKDSVISIISPSSGGSPGPV